MKKIRSSKLKQDNGFFIFYFIFIFKFSKMIVRTCLIKNF